MHLVADQGFEMLLRVADRCRCQHELRVAAVVGADAPQTAQQLRDVRAKYTAIDVRFVDHHDAQMLQHAPPAFVIGQDADMQHIGIG